MKLSRQTRIFLAAAFLWGVFIFVNSLMPGETSTQMSDSVVESLPSGWLSWLDIHTITLLVRKSAHFLEYALLGLLTAGAFASEGKLVWKNTGNLLFPCLFWAVADEFLQTFVAGRTGLIRDVMLDFGGILTGCLLTAGFLWLRKKYRRRL